MNRLSIRILLVAVIVSLFLAACQQTPPATSAPQPPESSGEATAATKGGTAGGTTGGDTGSTTGGQGGPTITQGEPLPAGIVLDPAAATSDSEEVAGMLYDGLVEVDADGNVTGALADRWTVSEDGLTYRFYLRPGLTFTDGAPVDADAVIANFNRWFDPESELRGSGAYEAWQTAFLGFKGETDNNDMPVSTVDGIEKENALTILIHLNHPDSDLPAKLAQVQFRIVNPATLSTQGESFGSTSEGVGGTGPYVVQDWTAEHLVLAPNPNYWGVQATDTIEYPFE